mmetsp:Transcript_8794/g.19330  ORF Transcript_8794/g.19330 Transcript_8794/m.19330 type:complete len:209 (+) Transcript_8794:191-817(+)
MIARQLPAGVPRDKDAQADHAGGLLCRSSRWPRELFDFIERLRKKAPALSQHVLQFPCRSLGAQQEHLQPWGKLSNLIHQVRRQQIPYGRVEHPLGINRGALADAARNIWLTGNDLELNTMVGEELIYLESFVRVSRQERLQVVLEDVKFIARRSNSRQCVLKWDNMNLFEVRRLVPGGEDLGGSRHDAKTNRLRRLHLQEDVANLED